ncbi:MAG: hypothetical protein OXC82_01390, partial [Rhodobacteraceae bacterium]|nr:hypothetical protein [Paracoccaceae bacterium]
VLAPGKGSGCSATPILPPPTHMSKVNHAPNVKLGLASRCLPRTESNCRIVRWEHADVIDRHHRRMANDNGGIIGLRGSLVKHPFGTLKVWAGVHHLQMRELAKWWEFNLMALCCNSRWVLNGIGVGALVAGSGRRPRDWHAVFFGKMTRFPAKLADVL